MNDQLPIYFVDWKPVLHRVCTRYEIQSPAFHLPLIRHKFAENSLRYCLIKQLNREKCSILITAKDKHTPIKGTRYTLNIMLLVIIVLIIIFFMLCLPKIRLLKSKQFSNFCFASPLPHIILYVYIIYLHRSLYVIMFLYYSMIHIVILHRLYKDNLL